MGPAPVEGVAVTMKARGIVLGMLAALAALIVAATPARAAERQSIIIVQGAAGEDEYGEAFIKSADNWVDAAKKANADYTLIGRDASPADESQDRNRLKKAIDEAAADATPPLWIVLIGHGTFDGRDAKFNLRGTDITDSELAAWVKPLKRPLAVIDCSSASSPFLARLSAPGRVVITATRSSSEVNYCRFGLYFSEAIADPVADLDKDGQISLLEAFLAAANRTNEFYKREGRLATEHALLDDNGDKLGISADWFDGIRPTRPAQNGAPLDGPRARQWALVQSPAEQAMPEELRDKRNALELRVEALHTRKATMSEDAYYAQLDPILLELAKIYAQEPAASSRSLNPPGQ